MNNPYINYIKIYLFLFLLGIVKVSAQNATISGYIIEAETGEVLINATVYDKNSKRGTLSNNFGFYSLSVPMDKPVEIIVSYTGFNLKTKSLNVTTDKTFNFYLDSENILEEVVLTGSKEKPIEKRNEMSVVEISTKEIEMLPALGGESDLLKAIQLMPGVQSGNEGSSGLYVRGGSPDQNLILLDDVPLYYVNHLGGFVSTFNTDAVNYVKLIKGGFPAQYGNRLSSVLDIRMKEGNKKRFQGKAMIGLVASKISVEGPIKKDTTSYIISFRRMLYDLITQPLSKLIYNGAGLGYHFYDINAKINHKFNKKNHLFLSAYFGDDRVNTNYKEKANGGKNKVKNNMNWGNNLVTLRWNHLYNEKLFSNVTLAYTRYRFLTKFSNKNTIKNENFEISRSFKSGVYDLIAKADFEYFANTNYKLKFGLNGTHHTFRPGVSKVNRKENKKADLDIVQENETIKALESSVYIENEIKIGKRFTSNIGLRAAAYSVNNKTFYSVEPRIMVGYLIADNMSLKGSYAKMQQNVHLLTSEGVGFPMDLWLPATDKIVPQGSEQFAFGLAKSIQNNIYEFSIEGYYKKMEQLIAYKEGAGYRGSTINWQNKVETGGKGLSYGFELLLQKKKGKSTGWLAYTYSKSTRQFDNINFGKKYAFKYDRRHDISIVFNHKLNKHIDFSATWTFGTGNPFTIANSRYAIIDNFDNSYFLNNDNIFEGFSGAEIYKGKNNYRMRSFHRLDIGFNFRKQKKHGVRTWNLSVFNLYNRQNPYFYFFDYRNQDSNEIVMKQQSLFPIMPSVSYSFQF